MVDIIITNGKVVTPYFTVKTAVAVDDGKIVAIGSSATLPNCDIVIDAKGMFVLPGGIDPHVHMDMAYIAATTKAASSGGTTTIIDFAKQQKESSPMKAVQDWRSQADGKAVIDYSIHPIITQLTPETIGQLPKLIANGLPSFKLFLTFRELGYYVDDGTLLKVFEKAKTHGGLVGCHAENSAMIEHLRDEAIKNGQTEAIYHALTRPPIAEAEAVNRVMFIAKYLKAPYYNFHLTIKEGVNLFRDARNKGQPMYAETCTHYLVKTMENLKGKNGINFICSPPLRSKDHIDALWRGLEDGALSVVSSDHCPFTTENKKLGEESFDKVPNGIPGIEFRLPILFSEGVRKGRININRYSEITSTNAAKIFGLYPKKGIINIGSDADIVILDPKFEKTIKAEDSMYNMDWSPYDGMKVKGYPVTTISKGKIIWKDEEFRGEKERGEFLKRRLATELFKRPIA